MKNWGLSLILWCACAAAAPDYRLVSDPADSARESALRLLALLAEGNLEAAAQLSNAPARRYAVLRDYRMQVGDAELRRIYGRYFAPGNRLVVEAARGERRLLIWQLGEADRQLAGQFFVRVDGRFVLDDIPSPERARLERVLADYRRR